MVAMAFDSSPSPGWCPVMAPTLEVEWSAEKTQFRVKVRQVYYGWFADTGSKKKAVLVL